MRLRARPKENKRKKGGTWKARLLAWVALLVAVSSIFGVYKNWRHIRGLGAYLGDSVLDHPFFSVREIKVSGGEKIGGSEIVAMAGLSHGVSVWKVDAGAIEAKVGKHPWVRRVLVRRELPGRVVIEIEERIAKGIVVLGKLFYVDSDGWVFKETAAGEKVDFPLLTGLPRADLLPQADSTRQRMREALRLAALLEEDGFVLSEIRFLPSGGLIVYPMNHSVAVHMGWGEWSGKKERLQRVLALWKGREDHLAALDLSFRDQVVARPRRADGWKG